MTANGHPRDLVMTDTRRRIPLNIFGMGFGLAGGIVPLPNPEDSMYWGGYGGSIIMIDMKARTTLSYAMNKMAGTTTGDMRALGLAMAMWTALGAI